MNELHMLRILNYETEYRVSILGKYRVIRPFRVFTDLLVTISFFSYSWIFLTEFHATVWHLVFYILSVTLGALAIAYLITHLREYDEPTKVYNFIREIDGKMNYPLQNQRDWILNLMAGTYLIVDVTVVTFILARGLKYYDLPLILLIPFSHKNVEVTVMKYFIAKRLRYLRSAEEYTTRVEDTIFITRQLLECNTTVNRTYGLFAAIYTMYNCQLALQFLHAMWAVHFARVETGFDHVSHLVLITIVTVAICFSAALLALCSSLVVDEVNEGILELDITYSARYTTENQQKLIYIFLLELHQTPVEMSALGLYDIGRSSVASACAIFTSYLLVLIQYT